MAHLAKYAAGAAGGVLKHDERTEKDKVQSRKNESIDSSRTHLNYNLAPKRKYNSVEKTVEEYTSREEIHLLKRKNVNVMCSWVVTMPTQLRREEQDKFFRELYKFLENRYGHKGKDGVCRNILTASVHLDETTPHMHFGYIPVAYDGKNNRYTVSAKLVNDRFDLQEFHKDLSSHMTKAFGRNIGIENGATKNGNQTIEQLKEKSKLEKEIQGLGMQISGAEKALKTLQRQVYTTEEEIHQVNENAKRTLTGGLKGIQWTEWEKMCNTASYVEKERKRRKQAEKEVGSLKAENAELKKQIEDKESEIVRVKLNIKSQVQARDFEKQQEISALHNKLSFYQKALKPEYVQKIEIAYQKQQHQQKKKGLSR